MAFFQQIKGETMLLFHLNKNMIEFDIEKYDAVSGFEELSAGVAGIL